MELNSGPKTNKISKTPHLRNWVCSKFRPWQKLSMACVVALTDFLCHQARRDSHPFPVSSSQEGHGGALGPTEPFLAVWLSLLVTHRLSEHVTNATSCLFYMTAILEEKAQAGFPEVREVCVPRAGEVHLSNSTEAVCTSRRLPGLLSQPPSILHS